MFDVIARYMFGDDIFVSYAHADAATYAAGLAARLGEQGLDCKLDQWGTHPGRELPPELRRSLRRSAMLVIVGSPAALGSEPMEQEVREFLPTRRFIVPVDLTGTIRQARWWPLLDGIHPAFEPIGESEECSPLVTGNPSDHVVSRVEKSFAYTRRSARVQRATAGAALLLGALLIGVGAMGTKARALSGQVFEALENLGAAVARERSAQENADTADARRRLSEARAARADEAADSARLRAAAAEDRRRVAVQEARVKVSERLALQGASALARRDVLAAAVYAAHARDTATTATVRAVALMLPRPILTRAGTLFVGRPIFSLAFSADGNVIAIGTSDVVMLLDRRSGTTTSIRPRRDEDDDGPPAVWSVALNEHGSIVAANVGNGLCAWATRPVRELWCDPLSGVSRYPVASDADGRYLLAASPSGGVWRQPFDAPPGARAGTGPHFRAQSLTESSDGRFAVVASLLHDGQAHGVRLRDWTTGRDTTLPYIRTATALAVSPDGRTIAAASDWTLYRLPFANLDEAKVSPSPSSQRALSVAFTPAGDALLVGEGGGNVSLLDPADGSALQSVQCGNQPVHAVRVSPDGLTVAAGAADGSLCLWHVARTDVLRSTLDVTDSVTAIDFDALTGAPLFGRVVGDTALRWSAADGWRNVASGARGPTPRPASLSRAMALPKELDSLTTGMQDFDQAEIDPGFGYLAFASAVRDVVLLKSISGAASDSFTLPRPGSDGMPNLGVTALAVASGGRYVAAGTRGRGVYLRDVHRRTGRWLPHGPAARRRDSTAAVAFVDSTLLVTAAEDGLRVWDSSTGALLYHDASYTSVRGLLPDSRSGALAVVTSEWNPRSPDVDPRPMLLGVRPVMVWERARITWLGGLRRTVAQAERDAGMLFGGTGTLTAAPPVVVSRLDTAAAPLSAPFGGRADTALASYWRGRWSALPGRAQRLREWAAAHPGHTMAREATAAANAAALEVSRSRR